MGGFAPAPYRNRHWRGHWRDLGYLVSAERSGPRAGNVRDGCNMPPVTPVAERVPVRWHHPGDYRYAQLLQPILDYCASPIPGGVHRYYRRYGNPGTWE